jgi:hypothetical protein
MFVKDATVDPQPRKLKDDSFSHIQQENIVERGVNIVESVIDWNLKGIPVLPEMNRHIVPDAGRSFRIDVSLQDIFQQHRCDS